MLRRSVGLTSGLIVVCSVLLVRAAGEGYESMTLTLPAGSPEAGRAAFLALSCTSCHRVAGEAGFPDPVSANRGPTLGRYQGEQTPARLAMSILAPSHEITATVREPREGKLSPMGDFGEAMTVRQFVDLIAYLRSLTAPGEPRK